MGSLFKRTAFLLSGKIVYVPSIAGMKIDRIAGSGTE